MDQLGLKDSSRGNQLDCIISYFFQLHLEPCLVPNKSPTYKSGDLKPVTYKSWVFGC